MRDVDLKNFVMTYQHTEAKTISPKKQGTFMEPHYMFCGTLVEEHCYRIFFIRLYANEMLGRKNLELFFRIAPKRICRPLV